MVVVVGAGDLYHLEGSHPLRSKLVWRQSLQLTLDVWNTMGLWSLELSVACLTQHHLACGASYRPWPLVIPSPQMRSGTLRVIQPQKPL